MAPLSAVAEPETMEQIPGLEEQLDDGGEAARLERISETKNAQADEMLEAGDEEAANIARIEADDAMSKAQELRAEGGEPTGAMPASAEGLQEVPLDPEEIIVRGIEMEYLDFGGKKPGAGSLKLVGGKVALEKGHAFPKDTRIKFEGEAVVRKVGGVDTADPKTGQVTSCEQQHDARIVQLYVSLPDD